MLQCYHCLTSKESYSSRGEVMEGENWEISHSTKQKYILPNTSTANLKFHLPSELGQGAAPVCCRLGSSNFSTVAIEVM